MNRNIPITLAGVIALSGIAAGVQMKIEQDGLKRSTNDAAAKEKAMEYIVNLRRDFTSECNNLSSNNDAGLSGLHMIVEQRDALYRSIGQQADERWLCKAVMKGGLRTGEYVPYFEYVQR